MRCAGTTVQDTDSQLLAELQRGSPEAFEALYDRYSTLAYTIAMRVLSDPGAAEDTVQEAFLSIWRNASSYREGLGSIRTWLSSIVRNRAIDRLRRDAPRGRHELTLDEGGDEPAPSDTWREVAGSLSRQEIQRALKQLPLEQRQTLELAYWCGLSQQEIGETMRVPLGTVKGRVRLALTKLREMLVGQEESWLPS